MIYLDYNVTTPVDPRVLEAMVPYFTQVFGNPASKTHAFGRAADEAVIRARNQVAALLSRSGRAPGCALRNHLDQLARNRSQ